MKKIYIVAGMPRSGTTFLYHTLQKHPSFFLPIRKEIDFFNLNYDKGLEWYYDFFKDLPNDRIGLDISPAYFLDSNVAVKIHDFNPEIKVILAIRDPVEFALSCYSQYKTYTIKPKNFESYLHSDFMSKGKHKISIRLSEVNVFELMKFYCNRFKENILVYDFQAFKDNPLRIMKSIEHFLDSKDYFNERNFENLKINASQRKNNPIVSSILRDEVIVNLLTRTMPASLLKRSRNYLDKKNAQRAGSNYSIKDDIELAKHKFRKQSKSIKSFFSKNEIMLGNGDEFL